MMRVTKRMQRAAAWALAVVVLPLLVMFAIAMLVLVLDAFGFSAEAGGVRAALATLLLTALEGLNVHPVGATVAYFVVVFALAMVATARVGEPRVGQEARVGPEDES